MRPEPAIITPLSDFTHHISFRRVDIDLTFAKEIKSISKRSNTRLLILITPEEEALVKSALKYSDSEIAWDRVQINNETIKSYNHWPTADYFSRDQAGPNAVDPKKLKKFDQSRREYWHAIEQRNNCTEQQARNLDDKITFKKFKTSVEFIENYLGLQQLKFSSQLPSRPNVGSHYLIHKESTNINIPDNMSIPIIRIQNSVPNENHFNALFDQINHMKEKYQDRLVVICDQDDMLLNRSEALAKKSCVLNAAVTARLREIKNHSVRKGIGVRFVSVTSRERQLSHEKSLKNPVSMTNIQQQVFDSTYGDVELLLDSELSFSNPLYTGKLIPKLTHFLNLTLSADDESDGSESTLSSIDDSYRSDNEDIESEDTESEDTENDNTRYHRMAEEKNSPTPCENLEAITINDKEDIRPPSPAGTDSDETAPPKIKRLNSSSSDSLTDSNTDESIAPPLDVSNALVVLFDDNPMEIDPWLIKKLNYECKINYHESNVQVVAIHCPPGVDSRDQAAMSALMQTSQAPAQPCNTIFTEQAPLNSNSEMGHTRNGVNPAPGV